MDEAQRQLLTGFILGAISQSALQGTKQKPSTGWRLFWKVFIGGIAGGLSVSLASIANQEVNLMLIYTLAIPAGWAGEVFIERYTKS